VNREIPIAEYRYEEIYPSFKAGTDEKRITSQIFHRFLTRVLPLQARRQGPVKVADIGCGPCDTIVDYLEGVASERGFIIRATDIGGEYASSDGKARMVLAQAQQQRRVPIADFSVQQGDSFAGALVNLLSAPGDDARGSFDLVFGSHMLYHADRESGVETLLDDVTLNLLSGAGLLMLCHGASPAGSFNNLRARFGRRSTSLDQSDTPAVNIGDPTLVVHDHCAARGVPLIELSFIARVHFPGLTDEDWHEFAHPRRYADLTRRSPQAAENLRRLLFVTERAPLEFEGDKSERGLDAYLAAAREVIEGNAGYLPLAERIQITCRLDTERSFIESVRAAAEAAQPAT